MDLHIEAVEKLIKSQVPLPYVLAFFDVSFNQMQSFVGSDLLVFFDQTQKKGVAELMVKRFELAFKKGNPVLIQSLVDQYVTPIYQTATQQELTFKIEIVKNDTHNTSN